MFTIADLTDLIKCSEKLLAADVPRSYRGGIWQAQQYLKNQLEQLERAQAILRQRQAEQEKARVQLEAKQNKPLISALTGKPLVVQPAKTTQNSSPMLQ